MTDDDPRPDALALADRFDARAAALEAEAADLRYKAAVLRGTVSDETRRVEVAEDRLRLTMHQELTTLTAMNATAIDSNALRSRARMSYGDNAFVTAMAARGDTVAKVAADLTKALGRPFHRNTVQGWYVPVGEPSHRDTPRDAAEFLRKRYGKADGKWRVPIESWPRVRG